MSNVKAVMEYAAKLYQDAMTGRLNANESMIDTTQLINEAFAKAFEAYKSDREEWVGLKAEEINHIFAANAGYPERMMQEVANLLKEKNT